MRDSLLSSWSEVSSQQQQRFRQEKKRLRQLVSLEQNLQEIVDTTDHALRHVQWSDYCHRLHLGLDAWDQLLRLSNNNSSNNSNDNDNDHGADKDFAECLGQPTTATTATTLFSGSIPTDPRGVEDPEGGNNDDAASKAVTWYDLANHLDELDRSEHRSTGGRPSGVAVAYDGVSVRDHPSWTRPATVLETNDGDDENDNPNESIPQPTPAPTPHQEPTVSSSSRPPRSDSAFLKSSLNDVTRPDVSLVCWAWTVGASRAEVDQLLERLDTIMLHFRHHRERTMKWQAVRRRLRSWLAPFLSQGDDDDNDDQNNQNNQQQQQQQPGRFAPLESARADTDSGRPGVDPLVLGGSRWCAGSCGGPRFSTCVLKRSTKRTLTGIYLSIGLLPTDVPRTRTCWCGTICLRRPLGTPRARSPRTGHAHNDGPLECRMFGCRVRRITGGLLPMWCGCCWRPIRHAERFATPTTTDTWRCTWPPPRTIPTAVVRLLLQADAADRTTILAKTHKGDWAIDIALRRHASTRVLELLLYADTEGLTIPDMDSVSRRTYSSGTLVARNCEPPACRRETPEPDPRAGPFSKDGDCDTAPERHAPHSPPPQEPRQPQQPCRRPTHPIQSRYGLVQSHHDNIQYAIRAQQPQQQRERQAQDYSALHEMASAAGLGNNKFQ